MKKFIKDVLNDRCALIIGNENILDAKIGPTGDIHQYFLRKVNENSNVQFNNIIPYFLCISQGVGKEMAGSIHTLTCCLSKLRSSLESGKKQIRVWLQYVCGVTEMFLGEPGGRAERLYSSFSVGFNPTFLTLGRLNAFVLHSLNRKVPLVLL